MAVAEYWNAHYADEPTYEGRMLRLAEHLNVSVPTARRRLKAARQNGLSVRGRGAVE